MCGIAGHAGRRAVPVLGDGVLDALRHRGPDAQCTERCMAGDVIADLAFARLAIVDLSDAGEQPMSNEDGRFTMVFNGEIYNSPTLRRECERAGHRFRSSMDGEVILHLWEMEGTSALERLNGIFALAMLDSATGETFPGPRSARREASGVCRGCRRAVVRLRAARTARHGRAGRRDRPSRLSPVPVISLDSRSAHPVCGRAQHRAGTVLRWTPEGSKSVALLQASASRRVAARDCPENAVEELRSRFADAVRRQLLSDVPIALMASGGVDSSLIWWAAGERVERAYTIDWSGTTGDERLSEDATTVRALSGVLGTPVTYVAGEEASDSLPRAGDLFADPAHDLARTISCQAAGDGFKVLLSGQGGDELFAGYARHRIAPFVQQLRLGAIGKAVEQAISRHGRGLRSEYLTRISRAASESEPFASYMQLCTYSTAADRARVLDCSEAEVSNDAVWQRHRAMFDALPAGVSFLRKVMALDLTVYLPGLGLAYNDRASMEQGVEVRVPWLDLELVRWSLTLPDSVLIRRQRAKWLPKELATRVVLPQVALRPKRGFAAPAHHVAPGLPPGSRGFRQGRYFALATSILEQHHVVSADRSALT